MGARFAAIMLLAAAASGCASSVYEGKYAWDEGWREAKVVKVGHASELGGRHSTDCRYSLPQEQVASFSRFAVVSFFQTSRQRRGVVPLALNATAPKVGEPVYANVRRCKEALIVPRHEPRQG